MVQRADDGTGMRIAYASGVFVSLSYGPPTAARLQWCFDIQKGWVENDRFSSISIIDPGVGKDMPRDARLKAGEITSHWKHRMVASATVVPGTGFFPAMVRSVVAGLQLISSSKAKWTVTDSVDNALAFVTKVHTDNGMPIDLEVAALVVDAAMGKPLAPASSKSA